MSNRKKQASLIKKAVSDLLKLDAKGISLQALQAIYSRDVSGAMQHPGMVALVARRKERLRRIMDELKNPMSHLKPQKPEPMEEAADMTGGVSMGPAAPGSPMPPSNLLGMFGEGGMPAPGTPAGGQPQPGNQPKFGGHPAELIKLSEDEDGAESPQEEAAESLDPKAIEELVNTIVSKGQAINDDDVHAKAESMGVNPHEAEEAIYRLLASLVGGKNDIIPGGLSAGLPTEDFPQKQLQAGRKVETEHSSNPVIANEITKDHLVEGEDYYDPRLEDLEKGMDKAKEDGEIKGVDEDNPKAKKNVERKDKDVKKLEKKEARIGAYKYGFFSKVAELGLMPSEFMKLAADDGGSTLSWAAEKALGAGKTVATAPMVAAPAIGALLGGGYRLATSPKYESPEEMRELETLALYRKLTRQALLRASRLQRARLAAGGGNDEKPIKIPAVA